MPSELSSPLTFRSKVDLWLPLMFLVISVRVLWPVPARVMSGGDVPWMNLLMPLVLLALYSWLVRGTRYEVDDRSLTVRAPLTRAVVPLDSIYKLRRSATLLAAPALSLDRIEVLASKGPYVVVSPREKLAFIRAIRERNAAVALEGLPVPDETPPRRTAV
jgi:hypothetical protein